MSESLIRRHGLEPLLAEPGGSRPADPGASVTVRGDLGYVNLRGRVSDASFVQSVEKTLGQPLPIEPNTSSLGQHRVLWLGPDEWAVIAPAVGAARLAKQLELASADGHVAVNDLSGGQVALELKGPRCRDLLAKGCTLDLHPSVFSVGDCAQSGLAKASVLIALTDETPTFLVMVRRSFSDYLCRWLAHAGSDEGIVFTEA
jgi:sarcosine oxidase subunit gamma